MAKNTASLPLQQYTGPRVAGFTPDQQAAFGQVQGLQGVQNPFINASAQYAAQGASPSTAPQVNYSGYTPDQFNAEGLSQFYNPYQQNVIDATLANIRRNDNLQQGGLLSSAIMSGASPFGGDRAGIAAAELARNQGLARNQTIAGLESQGFNTALGAYQNQQQTNTQAGLANAASGLRAQEANAANTMTTDQANAARASGAAGQFAGLGQQAQTQGLAGAGALLQSGQLQQAQNQQQLDIPYQNFQAQQAYPREIANWLVNAINGNPTNLGSTQTQPAGNTGTSVLGALTSLAGLFGGGGLKEGGAVTPEMGLAGFDDGGAVGNYGIATPQVDPFTTSYHPQAQPVSWQWSGGYTPMTYIPAGLNSLPQISQSAMPPPSVYQLPAGLLAAIQAFPQFVKPAKMPGIGGGGGGLNNDHDRPRHADNRFAGGGLADFGLPAQPSINDMKLALRPRDNADFGGPAQPSLSDIHASLIPKPLGNIQPVVPAGLDAGTPATEPSAEASGLDPHPQIDRTGKTAKIVSPDGTIDTGIPNIKVGNPLLDVGLGMMASKSPFFLQGIGEGALTGLSLYSKQKADAAQSAMDRERLGMEKEKMNRPTWGPIGTDDFGQPKMGWINPQTQEITPASGAAAPASGAGPESGALYGSLPKPEQGIVDAMIDGRQPMPSSFALRSPYWMRMIAAANDKLQSKGDTVGFDASNWSARLRTHVEFTSGGPTSPAGVITSGNTAIQHLGQLSAIVPKLGNWSNIPFLSHLANQVQNAAVRGTKSGVALSQFQSIRDKYVEEVTRFYRGIGGNEADIARDIGVLDEAKSPQELQAAIMQQVDLMKSKISALQDRWHYVMGSAVPDFPIIQKKSQDAIDAITKNNIGLNGGGEQSGQSTAPPPAIDYLKQHPEAAADFDAKYGQGSAASVLGGQ